MPTVIPTFASLSGVVGRQFTLGIGTPVIPLASADCLEVSRKADVTTGGAVAVVEAGGGGGVWVPYIPNRATYGLATGGSGWLGTGPFSGCRIAFFTKDGRVGMAHIARPSANATVAWDEFRSSGAVMVLNEWIVPLPDQNNYSASYLFLDLSNPASVALVQVDVRVTTMGGSDGQIFAIKKVI